MNIFELRQRLIDDYSAYIKSFIQIRHPRIQNYVTRALFDKGMLWPNPLIQLNPMFQPGLTIDELVTQGALHRACAGIFRRGKDEATPQGYPLRLHAHQEQAIEIAGQGHSYVLTTGTGSGKSLSYIIPIVDYVLRHPEKPGIKAIVVYPMNALANSQEGELNKYLKLAYPTSVREITFRRYTGQEGPRERAEIIADPPDILLTNYVMLELILTRLRERPLLHATHLRFLVLDELHTYRGRQGADVALLVRRVRDRLTPSGETLQCIGTSATLANPGTAASPVPTEEQCREVAKMASHIFGCDVRPEHIIGETLVRVTDEVDETTPEFLRRLTERVAAPNQNSPQSYDEFIHDPLSIWLESVFGVSRQADTRLARRKPLRISGESESAAARLQKLTGESEQQCVHAIEQGLLLGYEKIKHPDTGRTPFAFRLHQFISKGDTVYATLEYEPDRHITLQYQQYEPDHRERVLFPLVFCRACGQEYYTVRWQDEQTFIGRDLHDQLHYTNEAASKKAKRSQTGRPGFLYLSQEGPWLNDGETIENKIPGEWRELRNGKTQLTQSGKKNMPIPLCVSTDGHVVEDGKEEEGIECYFVPAPFRFCLHCGVSYNMYLDNDFEKLAQLSSEGRSTATTILSLSTIRLLREARDRGEEMSIAPKMLSFTDNRQDASLQAGHFNDFVEIGLLRSALYYAVKKAGSAGLQHDSLTLKVFDALKLSPDKYTDKQELKYSAKIKAEQALRNVLGYRLYLDLRRGWRITSPNLEQCGLLEIEYQDLQEVCEDDAHWQKDREGQKYHEALRQAPPELRKQFCRILLDYMRRELVIKVDYLDYSRQEEIKQQSSQHLVAPWSIDEDEEMVYAATLYPRSRDKDDERAVRYLSGLGSYGRYVRRILRGANFYLKPDDAQEVIKNLLTGLSEAGLIEKVAEPRGENGVPGYQLLASTIIWREGNQQTVYHDPLRTPNLSNVQDTQVNTFFAQFYQDNADELASIQDIHAAEHTAQVPAERREQRETDFRANKLPILYCSPTMELGVDIAELNVVNMRNIPPTPANYAQRSGRAGRSGQPALVFSYCSTGSSHDQYFFRHPELMVSGAVSPPRLDLTNEDLIRSHVYAIWLTEANISLGDSLQDLLEVVGDEPSLAVNDEVNQALRNPSARQQAEKRARAVLDTLQDDLTEDKAPWYAPSWLSDQLTRLEQSFNTACERWRGLYKAAQAQRDLQNAIVRDASRTEDDKKLARRLRSEAEAQLVLLTASNTSERSELSEFYSYRYFASEGFLPGYNFPRLPLSAYIPARRSKQREEYLSRPRFLAISEFAPRAIVYHEGSRYIINRSILSVREDNDSVLTRAAKQCEQCGYLHPITNEQSLDVCIRCNAKLAAPLTTLFRLQNVSTRRRDKINSDEEERLRQGYDIRTGIRFPLRQDGRPSFFMASVEDEEGQQIASITYGQAATLWRINFGPLRRKDKEIRGFMLDTERGYWEKDDESGGDPDDPMSKKTIRVIPYVEDTRNCLLLEPLVSMDEVKMTSLQAALKSAIQIHYQLEDNELAAEPLPDRKNRRIVMFYEASEGGAGVLRQLLDDPRAIKEVARAALTLCHFDADEGTDLGKAELTQDKCEAACYHCLMTYSNQRDHLQLDRMAIQSYLSHLTKCRTTIQLHEMIQPIRVWATGITPEATGDNGYSEIEQEWLAQLQTFQNPVLPNRSHVQVGACQATPDFLYEDGVAIYVDGADAQRQERDVMVITALRREGYEVLRFGAHDEWDNLFEEYGDLFRRKL